MSAATLGTASSLSLCALGLAVLVVATGAGVLASIMVLRYADTPLAGWLLGVRNTDSGGEQEEGLAPTSPIATNSPTQARVVTGGAHLGDTTNEPEPLDHLAADFAVHAQAVRAQVSRYADLLADGDAVLRARLRRLEEGGSGNAPGHGLGGMSGGVR